MCFYLTKSVKVGKYLPKIVKVRKYQNNKSREIPKNTPKTHATENNIHILYKVCGYFYFSRMLIKFISYLD